MARVYIKKAIFGAEEQVEPETCDTRYSLTNWVIVIIYSDDCGNRSNKATSFCNIAYKNDFIFFDVEKSA
jgi:hypothetical protein